MDTHREADRELLSTLDAETREMCEDIVQQLIDADPDPHNPERLFLLAAMIAEAGTKATPAGKLVATHFAAAMRERARHLRN